LNDKIPHNIKDTLDAVIYGKTFHPKWFMKDYSVYHSSFLSFVFFLLHFWELICIMNFLAIQFYLIDIFYSSVCILNTVIKY
jgi:hypothetical protein